MTTCSTCSLKELYDPLNQLTFKIIFDNDLNEKECQKTKSEKVVEFLESLSSDDLQAESVKFYKWIIMFSVDTHKQYAEHLLVYFHSKGLLLNKKVLVTQTKQSKQRYLVIYDVNGQVFSKVYNSIREIREDTGKKPSRICKYLIPPKN